MQQEVRKDKGHQRQWPEDEHDPPGCHGARLCRVERASPVPQGRNPDLLGTLYDTCTQRPDLGGSALSNQTRQICRRTTEKKRTLTASSPKFKPKKANAAADEIA